MDAKGSVFLEQHKVQESSEALQRAREERAYTSGLRCKIFGDKAHLGGQEQWSPSLKTQGKSPQQRQPSFLGWLSVLGVTIQNSWDSAGSTYLEVWVRDLCDFQ